VVTYHFLARPPFLLTLALRFCVPHTRDDGRLSREGAWVMTVICCYLSCLISPFSSFFQVHFWQLTTVGAPFWLCLETLFLCDTIREMFEWHTLVGWVVTLVSGLVPAWLHKLADSHIKNPYGKFFFSARDRTPEVAVTVPPLSPAQLEQVKEAVRVGVQEGTKPLVDALTAAQPSFMALRETLRQLEQNGLTHTTTNTVRLAAPPQFSQGNG
jgi:hypothetical protein